MTVSVGQPLSHARSPLSPVTDRTIIPCRSSVASLRDHGCDGHSTHKKHDTMKKARAGMVREALLVHRSVSCRVAAASVAFIHYSLLHYMTYGNLVQCARSYTPCGED